MAYLGSWKIDDNLTFAANTHRFDTGAATDADSVPTYRVYEDETGTAIVTGSMALLDDANTTGFYSEQVALTAANGFEKGKCYTVYISATVNSVVGTMSHTLQIEAEVDANDISDTGTALTAVPWNSDWDAEVQSECQDAIEANNLDHLMKVAVSDRDTMPEVVDDTVLANIMTKTDGDTSDFDHATDSLEAIRDKQTDIETDTAEIGTAGAGLTSVGLADDAITSAKYDESTAYPLKAADSAATELSRVGGHAWHVAATGNDGNGGRSFADALLTVSQALINAADGDTIIIHPGTYTEAATVDCDTANKAIKFYGTHRENCIINIATGDCINAETGCEFHNLTIQSGTGSGDMAIDCITGGNKNNITIENCFVECRSNTGATDALNFKGERLYCTNSYFVGLYDGICIIGAKAAHFNNCTFKTTGTATGLPARAVMAQNGAEATFRDCHFISDRSDGVAIADAIAIYGGWGCVLENCSLLARCSSSALGDAMAIYCATGTGETGLMTVHNCSILTSSASGTAYDIWAHEAAAIVTVGNSNWDRSKTGGSGTISEIVGADGDTLETLSDEIASLTAAAGQAYLSSTIDNSGADVTSSVFKTDLTEATDDAFNGMLCWFGSGNLYGQGRRISDYDGTDKEITVDPAFTEAPADEDTFYIYPQYFRIPGAGAIEVTYTVYTDEDLETGPIEGVEVWITTDAAGSTTIWSGTTDSSGVLKEAGGSKPWLDAGTYYFWRKKSGYNFTNPDTETVA